MTPQQAGFSDHLSWLQCGLVKKVVYLPDIFTGFLQMEDGNCTNSSVVQMFGDMDAKVQLIVTVSGCHIDTCYFRLRHQRPDWGEDETALRFKFGEEWTEWGAFVGLVSDWRYSPSSLSVNERTAGRELIRLAIAHPFWDKLIEDSDEEPDFAR